MLQTLRQGDSGDLVRVADLLMTGESDSDGIFDATFEMAVKSWQGSHGLSVDGIIGPATWRALAAEAPTVSVKTLRYGAYAQAAQLLVGATADGIFGAKSKAAVIEYQQAHGLTADGIVGRKTWTMLLTGESSSGTCPNKQPPDLKQYDSRWAKIMYSSYGNAKQTIKSSGCGPTSMCDIYAAWIDAKATPPDMCDKALKWGYRTKNSGTAGAFFGRMAKEMGCKYKTTSGLSLVRECLDAGGYVVVCFGTGSSGKSWYKKWTSGGHYCVIWGYDGDTFYVNDPASSAKSRKQGTAAEILNCRKGFYCFWPKG